MFDEYYQYLPYGGRPTVREREISGSFYGRMHSSNKAKPFWAWHDSRTAKQRVLAPGQWALDPAYAVSRNLNMPQPFSLNYVFNPYLGIGQPTANEISQAQPAGTAPSAGGLSGLGALNGAVSEFRPKQSRDYDPNSKRGQFDLRFYVDHTMELYVQSDVVRYRFEGQQPRDDGSEYSQPIPRAVFGRFDLEQQDGRGEIILVERPSLENDYTAKLRISDTRGGDDRYHARLSWEWSEAAPATATNTASATATTSAASGGTSQVLSRHIQDWLRGASTDAGPAVTQQPNLLPGMELSSSDNNPGNYNNANDGLFEFRGRVDGAVVFRIRGDRVFAEAESGRPAEVERFSFSQALPAATLADVSVEKRDGRGSVVLLERPWQGNDFTAVVRVEDPSGGDDRYHFLLQWRR
jgi:hypothetical protein